MIGFRVTCPGCQETAVISVHTAEYNAWKDGMLIQDAMPSLNADQREQLITGICGPCWSSEYDVPED